MFISRVRHRSGYNRDDQQVAWGYYMYWFQFLGHHYIHEEKPADLAALGKDDPFYTRIYATIRYAKLHQLGHWMMGNIRIGPMRVGLSGSLGSDGLPASLWDNNVYARLKSVEAINKWLDEHFEVVPPDIKEAWGKDNGHNTCNSKAVHDYGAELFTRMYKKPRLYSWRKGLIIKRKPWIAPSTSSASSVTTTASSPETSSAT